MFGYSRSFKGISVFLNSLFQVDDGGSIKNYMQLFANDGNGMINPMKVKDEKNCKANFRNLAGDRAFHIRLEYQKPTVSLYSYNIDTDTYETCATLDF